MATTPKNAPKNARKDKAKEKPFAASEPISEDEARELKAAMKRSEAKRKKDLNEESQTTRDRRAMEKMREMDLDTMSTTPEEMIAEMKRERDMQRGEAATKKQMGTLGFKKGGLVTPRGQGKVMRSRKTRMC